MKNLVMKMKLFWLNLTVFSKKRKKAGISYDYFNVQRRIFYNQFANYIKKQDHETSNQEAVQ